MANLQAMFKFVSGLSRFVGFFAGLLMLFTVASVAADAPRPTPVLVELFTSEGCSSCPPADAFLRRLDTQPFTGAQLIVLEEHVDYWDDQGWKDPFSSHEWTLRQSEYADRLHVHAPYTPQMIVNGAEQLVGGDKRHGEAAVRNAVAHGVEELQISGVKIEGGKLHAHIETPAPTANADVFVAVATDHATNQVERGENGGRKLDHVAVLRSLDKVGTLRTGESFSKDVSVSADLTHGPGRLIVFLQERNQGKVLGAAMQRFQP